VSIRETYNHARGFLGQIAKLAGFARPSVIRTCPLCGHQGRFRAFGHPPRYDAQCTSCGSLERHRLLCLCAQQMNLFQGKTVLHFAAEATLTAMICELTPRYTSADVVPGRGMKVLDIEAIDLPAGSVEVVVASHVLEHVNDQRALDSLWNVLGPNGVIVLMVPVIGGWRATSEDPSVVTPEGREVNFGQYDHLRLYGRDFAERVERHGFEVTEFQGSPRDCVDYALLPGESVFVCRKRPRD